MIRKIKHTFRLALGTDLAGRNFQIHPDDTFLVSYPKSGNTWARFLLASLRNPGTSVSFANIEHLLPDVSSQTKRHLKNTPRPRLIKSHQYFDPRYKKVIYIVRDPRDVVLSQYRFFLKQGTIEDGYAMDVFVERFVMGDLNVYASWGANVGSWLASQMNEKSFLLLRYEDMIRQTAVEVSRVAEFLEINASPEHIQRCVEQGSADRMRELEKVEGDNWVVTKGRRKDIPFIGAAKAGGWKTSLSPRHIEQIESAWGGLMRVLGYEAISVQPQPSPTILKSILERSIR